MVTSVHSPFDTRILHREAASLACHGFKVFVVAPYSETEARVRGVRIVQGSEPSKSRLARMLMSWKPCLTAFRLRADLYHIHDPELIPWALALRLLTRKPVIYDVHEDYPGAIALKTWIPAWMRRPLAWIFGGFERLAAHALSAIVTADEAVATQFRNSRVPVVTLHNFPVLGAGAGASRGSQDRRRHRVQLVYVGSVSRERGQWLMLDIVRIVVSEYGLDAGLWIAGPFDSSTERNRFEAAVQADPQLQGRVDVLGAIPPETIPALLRSADIGLVPLQPCEKFNKNIPTKQFEYMAAGLPIVGSDLPPIRAYLQAAGAGLLAVPQDPRSHADAIALLTRRPELAAQLGASGHEAVATQYNWNAEAEKLYALYAHLLGARHDRQANIGTRRVGTSNDALRLG